LDEADPWVIPVRYMTLEQIERELHFKPFSVSQSPPADDDAA
jgi:hypothetical protein